MSSSSLPNRQIAVHRKNTENQLMMVLVLIFAAVIVTAASIFFSKWRNAGIDIDAGRQANTASEDFVQSVAALVEFPESNLINYLAVYGGIVTNYYDWFIVVFVAVCIMAAVIKMVRVVTERT